MVKDSMYNLNVLKETTLRVKKKPLELIIFNLGLMSLQSRSKFQKSIKTILSRRKL